jgi:hypothetical protein
VDGAIEVLGASEAGGVEGAYVTGAEALGVTKLIDGVATGAGVVLTAVSATSTEWARVAGRTAAATMTAAAARRRASRLLTMLFNPPGSRNLSGSAANVRETAPADIAS